MSCVSVTRTQKDAAKCSKKSKKIVMMHESHFAVLFIYLLYDIVSIWISDH